MSIGKKVLSPESQWIIDALSVVLMDGTGEAALTNLEKAGRSVDWQEVLRLATFHKIAAPLWVALKKAHIEDRIPQAVQQTLQDTYVTNLAIDAVQGRELAHVTRAFEEAAIDLIILKGLPLHRFLFPDQEHPRGAADIDVLVHRVDVDRSAQVLNRLGFVFTCEEGRDMEWYTRFSHQFQFVKTEGVRFPVMAELHWSATADFFGSDASFESILNIWEESRAISWGDSHVRILSAENLLFYQAFHMFSDWRIILLPMILDFSRLVKISWPSLSKEKLIAKGKHFGMGRVLAAAAWLGSRFYDCPELNELETALVLPRRVKGLLAHMIDPGRVVRTGKVDWKLAFLSFYPFDLFLGTAPDIFASYWQYRFRHSRFFQPVSHMG